MDHPPAREELEPSFADDPHRAPQIRIAQPNERDKLRLASRGAKVDLRLSVAEDVNMRRLVIVRKDHEPRSRFAMDDHHQRKYPNGLDFSSLRVSSRSSTGGMSR
jgi:hypothetical protein